MADFNLQLVPGNCSNNDKFPDFFCIGPQRTGSTWLHANLVRHPEILMHRNKETFFFSTIGNNSSPRYKYKDLNSYLASFKDSFGELVLKNYHALRRCRRFYSPKVIGESTASYCVLQSSILSDLQILNPNLKIIMLMRDPVERAWSHANKDLVRDTGRLATDSEYLEFFSRNEQLDRADYQAILDRWRAILKHGHILLAPSTRIKCDPEGLITDVLKFLGVNFLHPVSARHLASRQNPTKGNSIPESLRKNLEKILGYRIESYQKLISKVGPGLVI